MSGFWSLMISILELCVVVISLLTLVLESTQDLVDWHTTTLLYIYICFHDYQIVVYIIVLIYKGKGINLIQPHPLPCQYLVVLYNLTPSRELTQPWCESLASGDSDQHAAYIPSRASVSAVLPYVFAGTHFT